MTTDTPIDAAAGADWVMVPREPAFEMLSAGAAAIPPIVFEHPDQERSLVNHMHSYARKVWFNMLSAAPRPDAGEGLVRNLQLAAYYLSELPNMEKEAAACRETARALWRGEGKSLKEGTT